MASRSRDRASPLTLVRSAPTHAATEAGEARDSGGAGAAARDHDWSILMARPQDGDGEAYRKLLGDIAPYLRSLARRHHRDPGVSEVMVNAPELIYYEKSGVIYKSRVRFRDDEHIIRIIQRIVAPLGRRVDEASPYVDARLPDGSGAKMANRAIDRPAQSVHASAPSIQISVRRA